MKAVMIIATLGFWTSVWFTQDQWGQHLYRKEKYAEAAAAFADPMHRGVAWYRAGNFDQAVSAFRSVQSAEGKFNLGNALVMGGNYEGAVEAYDQALEIQPEWKEAQENRELARLRAEAVKAEGGNMTEGEMGADEIVFDDLAKGSDGAGEEVVAGEELSDAEQQAMWMRKVQTSPGDFLKTKFMMQAQMDAGREE
ncbi:tetratricopeptide repeat protein [Kiritimatiellaeota bacterium B1221]|nr:tetratricopeptide repeat protein [Kiritimatiellaeota bacterium B1221]